MTTATAGSPRRSLLPARAALAIAAALIPLAVALAQQGPRPVTVARPIVKEIVEDDEFVGRFEATAEVLIRARVSGFLEQTHFPDGSVAQVDQRLFTIDRRVFEAAFRQAEAQLAVADAVFAFAREQFERATRLIGNGTISQAVLDERRAEFLRAQASLEAARAAREAAMIDLDFSEVTAPIAGRLGRDLVKPGNLVIANDTVLTSIVATDPIHFYFDIDERYFLAYARDARVRGGTLNEGSAGLPVVVRVSDRSVPPVEGRLDFSENRLDGATSTLRVRAVFPNPDGVLAPGLFGRINVPGSLPYRGVLLPDEAIVADQNRRLVYVVDPGNRLRAVEVRPGPRIDGWRVIREGLDGSETVVVEGLVMLRPGLEVAPSPVDLPTVRTADFRPGR